MVLALIALSLFQVKSTTTVITAPYAVQGRLIDTACGILSKRDAGIAIVHSRDCIDNQGITVKLAIWDEYNKLIYLTPQQQKQAMPWRPLLKDGEVRVYVDEHLRINRQ